MVRVFLEKLNDVLTPSRKYTYSLWNDSSLLLGEDWESQIIEARDKCDIGLFLLSPAFLSSTFIKNVELPTFTSGGKPSIPVMLNRVDFELHDLRGLEKQQIFRLNYDGFKEPRAYAECKGQRRDTFILELFKKIEGKLSNSGNA